jgi:hypothetical protein
MRQIKNHPNYLITVEGKVFSLKTMSFLKLSNRGDGYHTVHLDKKFYRVHRIVAETYIPNPENKPEVNHMDGNKQNNMLCNLEWMTRSENIQHSFDTGLRPISDALRAAGRMSGNLFKKNNKLSLTKLVLDEETGIFYESAKEAAESIGAEPKYLWRRLNGDIKNNTKFKYV